MGGRNRSSRGLLAQDVVAEKTEPTSAPFVMILEQSRQGAEGRKGKRMFGPWYQVYVKQFKSGQPLGAEYAKRIDSHLNAQAASAFVAPDGTPIRNMDGEYEIRVFSPGQLGWAKFILTDHYGLSIERVVENTE